MKKILIILAIIPFTLFSQLENRTHLTGGANFQLSIDGYQLYKDYVVGAETILGLRLGKIFAGIGAGIEYTGSDYLSLKDSLGNELEKISLYNYDIPLFLDFTFGKKFYIEGKVGYSVKLTNIKDYQKINSETLFNTLGFGYSIPMGEKVLLDIAIEGKFNYSFVNTISEDYTTVNFLPIAKIGLRFAKL